MTLVYSKVLHDFPKSFYIYNGTGQVRPRPLLCKTFHHPLTTVQFDIAISITDSTVKYIMKCTNNSYNSIKYQIDIRPDDGLIEKGRNMLSFF